MYFMTYIRSHPEAVKVLSIMHYPAYNGPINTALLIQPVIEKDNIDILTLIPSGSDNLEQFFEHRRVPYRSEKLSRLRTTLNPLVQIRLMGSFISDIQRLRRLIKEIAVDVVLINGMENPHGAIAAKLEGKRVVGQILGLGIPRFARSLVGIWSRLLCDVVMMPGREIYKYFPGLSSPENCVFFFPPVDTERYSYSSHDTRYAEGIGVDLNRPVVGTIGNINPAKDYETFIVAAREIIDALPGCQFVIKGNVLDSQQELFKRLKCLVSDLGMNVGEDIFFVQDDEDSTKVLSLMDIYVQSSIGEGISTALLEAMAMARPVVATNVGATSEAVDAGETGLLVDAGDPLALADSVTRLHMDVDLKIYISGNAREFVMKYASVDSCVKAHCDAIRMVISQKRLGYKHG